MKEIAAALIFSFVLVLILTSIALTLVRNGIDSVCDAYTEYFSDVLEFEK